MTSSQRFPSFWFGYTIISNQETEITKIDARYQNVCVHAKGKTQQLMGVFSSVCPNRVERRSKDGLSSFLAFPSSWNESVLKNRLDVGRTTLETHILFPFVRNLNVHHELNATVIPPECPWNCSKDFRNPNSTRTTFCCVLHG